MQNEFYMTAIISIGLIILGILIRHEKLLTLISGYQHKEKKELDKEERPVIARLVGTGCIFIGVLLFIFGMILQVK
ncbi:DUF3784 domain-containing protein [Isobaculum melis]|uniref:Uncharacterized protein n=1 Tax=Isobaculum melis TaxID=142588 RepID=A0A1H9U2Z9_9LACT|nr:DUF3784 domain-containing protein [Isobaculum melis]SES03463.1 protein of unknown function [Isobaculum melis]